MHHLSSEKSCGQDDPSSPRRLSRGAAGLLLAALGLGLGISIHLFAIRVSWWWLPLVALLILGHGAIVGGLVWLVTRRRCEQQHGQAGESHEHHSHSHVLHNPRAYDWLARAMTLGGERKFRRRTLDLAELGSGEAVLDVGCGTGTLLIEAAKRVGPTGSAHGIDRSVEMLAHARAKAASQGVSATFAENSSDHLPFPDASFDAVFCTLTLHHLPASMQRATLVEMRRVLRPGGRMVIVDMQRPTNFSAVFSHIGLVHRFRSRATLPDWQMIEELLTQLGVKLERREPVWGKTVCALVGRVGSSPNPRRN